jgi:CobQ-like glutamine amidotransferase family enzyme
MTTGPLRILVLHPLLAQPQGIEGNGLVLRDRLRRRGMDATLGIHQGPGPIPAADLYLVGGVEDVNLPRLADALRAGGLVSAVAAGAGVLAVDAGLLAIGRTFRLADGGEREGIGLLDLESGRASAAAHGPVITRPDAALGLPAMSGYETHVGRTRLGAGVEPLARLELGTGNGDGHDGAIAGRVIATWLHGPTTARNPELADLLLGRILELELEPLDDARVHELRDQHVTEDRADPTGWGGVAYGDAAYPWRRWFRRGKGTSAGQAQL